MGSRFTYQKSDVHLNYSIQVVKHSSFPDNKRHENSDEISNDSGDLFRVTPGGSIESLKYPIWQVVSHKNGPHVFTKTWKIQINDAFMIGNIKLQVLESNNNQNISQDQEPQLMDEERTCRFCLSINDSTLDPLISICKCSGSLEWIHLECLRDWVKTKTKKKIRISTTFHYIENLKCQLCNVHIQVTFHHSNRLYSVIDPVRPSGSYILMAIVNPDPIQPQGIYVIDFDQSQSIKIGSDDVYCDIVIHDETVANVHAIVINQGSQITMQEGQSPNGILAHNGKNIPLKNQACFVVDNSLFQIRKQG